VNNGSPPVVVGVDGSADALTAVVWAAEEAARRNAPLRVVHANIWPVIRGHWPGDYADQLLLRSEELVQDAVRHARQASPGLTVSGTVTTGNAAPVLIESSRDALLVVVGSRGLGGFTGLLVGSTAVALAAHAGCPVVVVRLGQADRLPRSGPVVVGIGTDDGQLADQDAVRFAFAAAADRHGALTAVHTLTDVSATDLWGLLRSDAETETLLRDARERVEELLSAQRTEFPAVRVEVIVRPARPAAVLVELSGSAQLVVVGCRGRGGFAGLLLGSVSQALLHHASAPVAIVRG
jgi:nucleotide-binding universal stress UspA family protein